MEASARLVSPQTESLLRFTHDKIRSIAAKVVDMLENDPDATFLKPPRELEFAVAGALMADLEEEDEIDEEVERMLEQYQHEIDTERMDVELVRRRFKVQIAKKHGFVL